MVAVLSAFKRRHPGIQLAISFGNSETVLQDLFERRCEIAVLAEVKPDRRLYSLAISRDSLVAFVARGHDWSRRRSIRLEELNDRLVVLREPGSITRAIVDRALTEHAVRPAEVIEIGSREAVREAVAAGLGIGFVFEHEFGPDPRLHALSLRQARLEASEFAVCLEERRPVPRGARLLRADQGGHARAARLGWRNRNRRL